MMPPPARTCIREHRSRRQVRSCGPVDALPPLPLWHSGTGGTGEVEGTAAPGMKAPLAGRPQPCQGGGSVSRCATVRGASYLLSSPLGEGGGNVTRLSFWLNWSFSWK